MTTRPQFSFGLRLTLCVDFLLLQAALQRDDLPSRVPGQYVTNYALISKYPSVPHNCGIARVNMQMRDGDASVDADELE